MLLLLLLLLQGDDLIAATTRIALPLPSGAAHEAPRQITAEEREFEAYRTLREYRSEARYEGRRKVRKAKVRKPSNSHPLLFSFFLLTIYIVFTERRGRG